MRRHVVFFIAGIVLLFTTRLVAQEKVLVPDNDLQKLVADYTRLYAGPTLREWKSLFHPALSVANPDRNGDIEVRNLAEFYDAQAKRFTSGRRISEHLNNVNISSGDRIARISADFVFSDNGQEHRGKLGLHAIKGREGWKIISIIFSYD